MDVVATLRRWLGLPPGPDKTNEIIAQEWTNLQSLWRDCRSPAIPADQARIDALMPVAPQWESDAEAWYRLNFAEQAVANYLTAAQLDVEFNTLLSIAKARKLSTLDSHLANLPLFTDISKLDAQRAAYVSLLQALQADFVQTRFERRLRGRTAGRLLTYGVWVVVLAFLGPIVFFYLFHQIPPVTHVGDPAPAFTLFSKEPVFGLSLVAAFGILGAYFSRVIAFQSQVGTLGFDDVMNLYMGRILLLRMLYGMIGALIFYLLLRGKLLGGSAFPTLSNLAIGEQQIWLAGADGLIHQTLGKPDISGLTILTPTEDLAKLLVWSFLAGFSERLVPDALDKAGAAANKLNK